MLSKLLKSTIVAIACTAATFTASATPIVSFFIDGNTYFNSFELENDSTEGEMISSATIDFSGLGVFFDTVDGGAGNSSEGRQFTPVGGSDITTGLLTPVVVADGSTMFEMFFNDFNSGESIIWDIDVDFLPSPTRVDGDDLIGGIVTINFVSGDVLTGILSPVSGNRDASEFIATSFVSAVSVPEPTGIALFSVILMIMGSRVVRKS